MNLTNEEIRIKVAESLGWKHYGCTGCSHLPCLCTEYIAPDAETIGELPNYPESLDAIVPVIRALPAEDQWAIFETLLEVVPAKYPAACATAKEWCLAYLKTKGIIQ